jgi:hypothetical protein
MASKGAQRNGRVIGRMGGLLILFGSALLAAAVLGDGSATPVADAQQAPRGLDIAKDSPSAGVYRLMVRTWPGFELSETDKVRIVDGP